MRTIATLAPCCLALLLASCSSAPTLESFRVPLLYRVDVQQGNVVTQEMLAQLEAGMDKNKVRYIMGTPLLADVFHQSRWDYVYTQQNGGDNTPARRRVSLYFENDHLASIGGNVKAARAPLIYTPRQEVTIQVPDERKRSLFERLLAGIGFGEDDSDRVADQVTTTEIDLATHQDRPALPSAQ